MAQPSVDKIMESLTVRREVLTAGDLHRTLLSVQRVELEVHGTGEGQRHADTEEDRSVSVDPDVEVGDEHVVHGAAPLVPEERVRHPDLARVGDGEVGDLI